MLKKKHFLSTVFILICFIFHSCSQFSGKNECEEMIDRRTMAKLLTDFFLLEARIYNVPHEETMKDSVAVYYAGVFDKYNITASEFEKAFECYLLDEDNMSWVMDEVLSSLSIKRSKLDERPLD